MKNVAYDILRRPFGIPKTLKWNKKRQAIPAFMAVDACLLEWRMTFLSLSIKSFKDS